MHRRWKALAAACAAAMAFSGGSALAHLPDDESGGEPLRSPFGEKFWFFANFQTAQNPFNAANNHVTSSDIAFWGDLAYVGDYGGFRIFDVSKPEPKLVSDMRCYGPQGDPSVWDRDGDGDADTLALSVDSVLAGSQCGAGARRQEPGDRAVPGRRVGGPADLRRLRPEAPAQVAAVYQDCGSHTNTLLPSPDGRSMRVLNSSYPLGDGPTCGPLGDEQGRKVNHGVVQVIDVPFDDPSQASELTELPVVYPGDADGTYKPVSEHGIAAPLDDFLGCHDLSSFPKKGIVGAACGEQAQVWNIDKATGLPDTENPPWAYDQPNVDFWHSATFSWDGEVANFIDESFGDGCPTVTTKTGGLPGGTRQFNTGNMYFFDTKSGDLLSEYRNPRPSNDHSRPRRRPGHVLLLAPRHPGAVARPLPAGQRVLPGRLVGDRLHRPERAARDRVRRQGGHEHLDRLHVPAQVGHGEGHPGVLQRRPQPQLRHGRRPELPGGRVRLHALPGRGGQDQPRRDGPPEPAAAGAGHQEQVRRQGAAAARRARSPRARPRRTARATARRAPGRSSPARNGGPAARRALHRSV